MKIKKCAILFAAVALILPLSGLGGIMLASQEPEIIADDESVFGTNLDGTLLDLSPPVTLTATHDGKEIHREVFQVGGANAFQICCSNLAVGEEVVLEATNVLGLSDSMTVEIVE